MKYALFAFLVMIIFSSCFIPAQQAYYLSPQHATTNYYKTIPMVTDSTGSASYVSGLITVGAANHRLRDGVLAFQGNFHQARQWKYLQTFYGASTSMGVYDIRALTFPSNQVDAIYINERAGSKYQGGFGLQGGINYVMPFRNGEWRILGLEANFQQEYGSYYRFRDKLPEDAANVIEKSGSYNTLAITSHILGNFNDGSRIGYKFSYIQSLRKLSGEQGNNMPVSQFPRCASHTLHISVRKITGYGQLNFGTDAVNIQLGFVRRMRR